MQPMPAAAPKIGQAAFHGKRVFTTEVTENTEGIAEEANRFQKSNRFSPHPLCALCDLYGEYTRASDRASTGDSQGWFTRGLR